MDKCKPLLFGAMLLNCVAPFINIQFLGSSLTFMMVYVVGKYCSPRHQPRLKSSFVQLHVCTLN